MQKLIITNRELVHHWARLKEKLQQGDVAEIFIPENGHAYSITMKSTHKKPGDIGVLLERLEKMGKKKRVKAVRLHWKF